MLPTKILNAITLLLHLPLLTINDSLQPSKLRLVHGDLRLGRALCHIDPYPLGRLDGPELPLVGLSEIADLLLH
jgi:hypothetical protein